MTVVAVWNGQKAQALRMAMRLSSEAFAERLGLSARAVATWAQRPEVVPDLTAQSCLDTVLDQAGDGVVARYLLLANEDERLTRSTSGKAENDSLEDVEPLRVQLRQGAAVSPETIAYFRRILSEHYTADNLMGPRALLQMITTHARAIDDYRRHATGQLLTDLLHVGAGYAEFAGWMHHDAGDLRTAAYWYDRAMEWAQASGHRVMVAFVLMRKAAHALTLRDGAYAASLARAAQDSDGTPETARVRVIAAAVEAHGHALTGDISRAESVLTEALNLLPITVTHDDDPSIGRYCEPNLYLAIKRAFCYLETSAATEAVEAFTGVLERLPSGYHRDRGQYTARLAEAHALAGQPELACEAAGQALAIALDTGSTRTVEDMRRTLLDRLSPWRNSPAVLDVTERIAKAHSHSTVGKR